MTEAEDTRPRAERRKNAKGSRTPGALRAASKSAELARKNPQREEEADVHYLGRLQRLAAEELRQVRKQQRAAQKRARKANR